MPGRTKLPPVQPKQMASRLAWPSRSAISGTTSIMCRRVSSSSSVWAMRVKWTDTPAGAMRWHSYSITVFQDGTMKPSFFFQSVMGMSSGAGSRYLFDAEMTNEFFSFKTLYIFSRLDGLM